MSRKKKSLVNGNSIKDWPQSRIAMLSQLSVWVLRGSAKGTALISHQVKTKAVCVCFTPREMLSSLGLRQIQQKDLQLWHLKNQTQNINSPMGSWQNKLLASSDTDTTQIPHQGWQMCFTMCEKERRVWQRQSHSDSDRAEGEFKSPVESLCLCELVVGMRG